ncbi:solute carrier family 25 member 46-like [Oppia nitens]|uniref:solute carrier family 25 member 46-like n=1 Tax=Oppia nitens TaxID=1686743 RepID=UPI0023DC1E77|nr:solute carrier family 25 member 46-like [Oppia nitens]
MSDNLRHLIGEDKDIDIWRLSSAKSDQNLSHTHRRKVEFNVSQRLATTDGSGDDHIDRHFADSMAKESSDREMKIAVVVLDSVNVMTQYLITHPFVVIRRQTQVTLRSQVYHLTPFTVIAFIVSLQSKQGFGVLWKGIASVFITKAIQIGFESVIAELTTFPKDISSKRKSFECICQHLILKGMAIILVTPFMCSGSAETVQSSIATENPGIFDTIWEGFRRITHWKMDRKLPIWLICGPTLSYHLGYYIISNCIQNIAFYARTADIKDKNNENTFTNKYRDIMNNFWGQLVADIMLFPLQTVLMRLYLQGTRTIIDNIEKPNAVIPILSNYESTSDCITTIVKNEGKSGLFKGFGALVLQYSIHYLILRLTKCCLKKAIPSL